MDALCALLHRTPRGQHIGVSCIVSSTSVEGMLNPCGATLNVLPMGTRGPTVCSEMLTAIIRTRRGRGQPCSRDVGLCIVNVLKHVQRGSALSKAYNETSHCSVWEHVTSWYSMVRPCAILGSASPFCLTKSRTDTEQRCGYVLSVPMPVRLPLLSFLVAFLNPSASYKRVSHSRNRRCDRRSCFPFQAKNWIDLSPARTE